MNRAILQEALKDARVRAFLRVIREGESGQTASAYRMRYGGAGSAPKYFDDLSQHPKIFEQTPDGLRSSAAGAYQATWTSWVETASLWGLPDFSEQSQDEFAVARIIFRRGERYHGVGIGGLRDPLRERRNQGERLLGRQSPGRTRQLTADDGRALGLS